MHKQRAAISGGPWKIGVNRICPETGMFT